MELEGFGIPLTGRLIWLYDTSAIPWEFLQSATHTTKVLIRGSQQPTLAEAEMNWTCVWNPTQTRDWSCIATILRNVSAAAGTCLLVLDHVNPPTTFWSFLDSLQRISRVWMHEEPPPHIPDATFFAPTRDQQMMQRMLEVFSALPGRSGHGHWSPPSGDWSTVVAAATDQGMGLMVSDLEEHGWTLMWHRIADSRPPAERRIPIAQHWLRIGMQCLDSV